MNSLYVDPVIQNLNSVLSEMISLEQTAQKNYNHYHAMMVDLQHEVELSEGYDPEMVMSLFSDLKNASAERRKWKDTTILIAEIRKNMVNGIDVTSLSDVISSASGGWSRNYSPRVIDYIDFTSTDSLKQSRKLYMEGK